MLSFQIIFTALSLGSCTAFMAVPAPAPSTASILHYGPSTLDRPFSVEDSPDFENRMRNAVTQNKSTAVQKKQAVSRPDSVQVVLTMDEFNKVVADEPEKLVVVRFHAPWCRACKLMTPTYYKLAQEIDGENVKFVDCPMSSVTNEIHKELGIKSIPFAHVYHPEAGLVEECSVGRKQLSKFEKVVQSYLGGSCEVAEDCSSPYKP